MALAFESRNQMIESVYDEIKQHSGKIRSIDLDRTFDDIQGVRFAITRLTIMGRIRRVRGFGSGGIEYFYHATESKSFEKHRRMQLRMFAGTS